MAAVGAVLAVAGIVLTVAANEEQAKEEKKQANESARLKDLQANEIMKRLNINIESAEDEAKAIEEYGLARIGASEGDSSATLAFLTDTQVALRKQIYNLQSDASFNAFTLRTEAAAQRRLGKMVESAAGYKNTAAILQGSSSFASSYSSSQKTQATSLNSSGSN